MDLNPVWSMLDAPGDLLPIDGLRCPRRSLFATRNLILRHLHPMEY